jgi:hypothetical protein
MYELLLMNHLSFISFLFFLHMGYLSFFSISHFFHHAFLSMSFISFCIAHILFLIVVTLERVVMEQHGVLYYGWMDEVFANFWCRSIAYGGGVCVILIMGV